MTRTKEEVRMHLLLLCACAVDVLFRNSRVHALIQQSATYSFPQRSVGANARPSIDCSFSLITTRRRRTKRQVSKKDQQGEADLFEFFDPLLSPHAYPDGIAPDTKPIGRELQIKQQLEKPTSKLGFKLSSETETNANENEERKDKEKFDHFDPLLSPHSYPNGIQPSPTESNDDVYSGTKGSSSDTSRNNKMKTGVLLIDHGSRKEASNDRLQAMAKLYQMTLHTDDETDDISSPTIIVRHAHMEIATPSISDGLKSLKDEGVDEIICHPFFLSPGRHVKEDIPQIIEEAVDALWGVDVKEEETKRIPIVITAPVGSNTQLMLGAIHSSVRENSLYLKTAA